MSRHKCEGTIAVNFGVVVGCECGWSDTITTNVIEGIDYIYWSRAARAAYMVHKRQAIAAEKEFTDEKIESAGYVAGVNGIEMREGLRILEESGIFGKGKIYRPAYEAGARDRAAIQEDVMRRTYIHDGKITYRPYRLTPADSV